VLHARYIKYPYGHGPFYSPSLKLAHTHKEKGKKKLHAKVYVHKSLSVTMIYKIVNGSNDDDYNSVHHTQKIVSIDSCYSNI
jgi:hypothetical protein